MPLILVFSNTAFFAIADTESKILAFSKVGDLPSKMCDFDWAGAQVQLEPADLAFSVETNPGSKSCIFFDPPRERGRFEASLLANDSRIELRGIVIDRFEGKNEPTLDSIFWCLGVSEDAGGEYLSLDTEGDTIGSSIPVSGFRVAEGYSEITVSLLARYSPKGNPELGFLNSENGAPTPIGRMANVSREYRDAHQRLFPPFEDPDAVLWNGRHRKVISSEECPPSFNFYYAGKHFRASTIPGEAKGAKIKHTARVYPVESLLGNAVKNAYLICFEEAKNGDYQDAILLIEGIEHDSL
ncbi:MAG: hypothetical protein ACPGN3_02020 [Opitutales bacterium]